MTGRPGRPAPAGMLVVALLALLAPACATSSVEQRQAEVVGDGVQVTGTLDGARVAISEGVPDVVFGDCDPGIEVDADVCWSARTIDGMLVTMVLENPDVLVVGETVPVVDHPCGEDCDDVDDGAVVDVRAEGDQQRAVDGRLEVSRNDDRVAARIDLVLADRDRLTGSFDVREPRPGER